jgi:hypothetical protein
MFVFFLTFTSRLWGIRALRNVSVERGKHRWCSPARASGVRYTVRNDKLLPLIWLELLQEPSATAAWFRTILRFANSLSRRRGHAGTRTEEKSLPEKLAFIMSFREVSWESRYTAHRRGIYQVKTLELRSGTASLCAKQKDLEIPRAPRSSSIRRSWACKPGCSSKICGIPNRARRVF